MSIIDKIDERLDETSLLQYKSQDAAGKIMGMYVGKKRESIREILAKSGAVKSVGDSVKLVNQMAKIILDEME